VRVARYEDLVQAPLIGFRELYADRGLTWSARSRQRVERATTGSASARSAHSWSLAGGLSRTAYRPMSADTALGSYQTRLTPAEIDRVRELTSAVALRFYPPAAGQSRGS